MFSPRVSCHFICVSTWASLADQGEMCVAGGLYDFDPILSLTAAGLRKYMQQNVEPNLCEYDKQA
jgi:hypothetical protein